MFNYSRKASVTGSERAANVYLFFQHVQKVGKTTLIYIINVAAEEPVMLREALTKFLKGIMSVNTSEVQTSLIMCDCAKQNTDVRGSFLNLCVLQSVSIALFLQH